MNPTPAHLQPGPQFPPAPSDTVPAMLTPGEEVINPEGVELAGRPALENLNRRGLQLRAARGGPAPAPGIAARPSAGAAKPRRSAGRKSGKPRKAKRGQDKGYCKGGRVAGYGDGGIVQGAMNALGRATHGLIGPSAMQQETQARTQALQHGGLVADPAALPAPAIPVAAPVPVPAAAAAAAAPVAPGLLGGAIGALQGRRAQIDRASGWANGGEVAPDAEPDADADDQAIPNWRGPSSDPAAEALSAMMEQAAGDEQQAAQGQQWQQQANTQAAGIAGYADGGAVDGGPVDGQWRPGRTYLEQPKPTAPQLYGTASPVIATQNVMPHAPADRPVGERRRVDTSEPYAPRLDPSTGRPAVPALGIGAALDSIKQFPDRLDNWVRNTFPSPSDTNVEVMPRVMPDRPVGQRHRANQEPGLLSQASDWVADNLVVPLAQGAPRALEAVNRAADTVTDPYGAGIAKRAGQSDPAVIPAAGAALAAMTPQSLAATGGGAPAPAAESPAKRAARERLEQGGGGAMAVPAKTPAKESESIPADPPDATAMGPRGGTLESPSMGIAYNVQGGGIRKTILGQPAAMGGGSFNVMGGGRVTDPATGNYTYASADGRGMFTRNAKGELIDYTSPTTQAADAQARSLGFADRHAYAAAMNGQGGGPALPAMPSPQYVKPNTSEIDSMISDFKFRNRNPTVHGLNVLNGLMQLKQGIINNANAQNAALYGHQAGALGDMQRSAADVANTGIADRRERDKMAREDAANAPKRAVEGYEAAAWQKALQDAGGDPYKAFAAMEQAKRARGERGGKADKPNVVNETGLDGATTSYQIVDDGRGGLVKVPIPVRTQAPGYAEGQALRGADGRSYVVRNGQPVPATQGMTGIDPNTGQSRVFDGQQWQRM